MEMPHNLLETLKAFACSVTLVLLCSQAISQNKWHDSADTLVPGRRNAVIALQAAGTAVSFTGLYVLWYKDYPQSGFHFINDSKQWLQVDKIGHALSVHQITHQLYDLNRWTGASEKSSLLWAAGAAYGYMLGIEIMDGLSANWGFSGYDILANTIGSGLFVGQQLAWKEQRFSLKFSYTPDPWLQKEGFPGDRARHLYGSNLLENIAKDYNGQTVWLSMNIWSLCGKPQNFPRWINVAVGHSAENMLGAKRNRWMENGVVVDASAFPRYRQFLLSLDVDLTKIENKPLPLELLSRVFQIVKVPFPALEINTLGDVKGHAFYF